MSKYGNEFDVFIETLKEGGINKNVKLKEILIKFSVHIIEIKTKTIAVKVENFPLTETPIHKALKEKGIEKILKGSKEIQMNINNIRPMQVFRTVQKTFKQLVNEFNVSEMQRMKEESFLFSDIISPRKAIEDKFNFKYETIP